MDVITLGGFIYPIVSDVACFIFEQFNSFKQEDKIISLSYMEENNISQRFKTQGYKIRGTRLDKVSERLDKGWQYIYEIDEKNKKYYRLIRQDSRRNIEIVYMFIAEDKQQGSPKNIVHKFFPINAESSKLSTWWSNFKKILFRKNRR